MSTPSALARLVLIGATGLLGRTLARTFAPNAALDLVLAGRDRAKLEALHAELPTGGARISVAEIDVCDPASVRAAFAGARLIVCAASVPSAIATLIDAAIEAKADLLETMLSNDAKLSTLRAADVRAHAAGVRIIGECGLHPGLLAAMVRYLLPRFDTLTSALIYARFDIDWQVPRISRETMREFVAELAQWKPEVFRDGVWRRELGFPRHDFSPAAGSASCAAMPLPELYELPKAIPSLKETGFFVAGFHPLVDFVLMPAMMVALRAFPRLALGPAARLFGFALDTFATHRRDPRLIVDLDARGEKAGKPLALRLRLVGADAYLFTGLPVVAMVEQMLAGERPAPGLSLQGLVVDPARVFAKLAAAGTKVEVGSA